MSIEYHCDKILCSLVLSQVSKKFHQLSSSSTPEQFLEDYSSIMAYSQKKYHKNLKKLSEKLERAVWSHDSRPSDMKRFYDVKRKKQAITVIHLSLEVVSFYGTLVTKYVEYTDAYLTEKEKDKISRDLQLCQVSLDQKQQDLTQHQQLLNYYESVYKTLPTIHKSFQLWWVKLKLMVLISSH